MKKQLLFVMFMVMGLFASAQNSDREEAYRDGYRDGQEDAERSGQQSQQEREEEAYRRGYRDGQRDARDRDGGSSSQSDRQQERTNERDREERSTDRERNESRDESSSNRPQSRAESRGETTKSNPAMSGPSVQISTNYVGLYPLSGFKTMALHDTRIHNGNFGVAILGRNIGLLFESGLSMSKKSLSLTFYDTNGLFDDYTREVQVQDYILEYSMYLRLRKAMSDFWAITTDFGWYYGYNLMSNVQGLETDEERAFFESDFYRNYVHNHGPVIRFGLEFGNARSSGLYIPAGYIVRYNALRRELMHGFYVGLGINI